MGLVLEREALGLLQHAHDGVGAQLRRCRGSGLLDGREQIAHFVDAIAPVALLAASQRDLRRCRQQEPHHVVVLGVAIGALLKVVEPGERVLNLRQRFVVICRAVIGDCAQVHRRAAHVLEHAVDVGVRRVDGSQRQHRPVQVHALNKLADLLQPEPAVDCHGQRLAPCVQAALQPVEVEGVELDARLHVVHGRELRVEPRLNRPLAQQADAERVDGLHVGAVQVAKGNLDALRVWRLAAFRQVFKALPHAAHQLGSGELRERDDRHVVNVDGLAAHSAGGEDRCHARHHRGGLAGAGAGLDAQVLVNGLGNARAVLVIDDAHAISQSVRKRCTRGSSALRSACTNLAESHSVLKSQYRHSVLLGSGWKSPPLMPSMMMRRAVSKSAFRSTRSSPVNTMLLNPLRREKLMYSARPSLVGRSKMNWPPSRYSGSCSAVPLPSDPFFVFLPLPVL